MNETAAPAAAQAPDGDIVARYDRTYRLKWLTMGVALVFGAMWFLRDGYYTYQAENEKTRQEAIAAGKPPPERVHSDLDIRLQRIIGWSLIPVAVFVLFRTFHTSRGEYRLSGGTLHVPGHPPVPMDAIRAIDESKWDRKGIAYIDYDVNGTTGRLKLDDYVYQRDPTDQIHDRILAAVAPEETGETSPADEAPAG
jgi:hypothetical protein